MGSPKYRIFCFIINSFQIQCKAETQIAIKTSLGLSIKDVRSQRGGSLFNADKGRGVFFRCGRPHFLVQITSDFLKFMVCPHGQGGLSQCWHFADRGEEGRFCADFYGRPLLKKVNSVLA